MQQTLWYKLRNAKSFRPDGDPDGITTEQMQILGHSTITFILGTHFNCPPHMWDDQPPERVMLDYFMVRAAKEQEAKQMEKMNREAKRGEAPIRVGPYEQLAMQTV